jgi:transcription-repair coupling factor (superfamily II helicase)
VPDGFDALVVADLARALKGAIEGPAVLVQVARDGQRQQLLQNALGFVAPEIEVLAFPAWDCQPYDRTSPNAGTMAQRMTTLARLARSRTSEERPPHPVHHRERRRSAHSAPRPHGVRELRRRAGQRGRHGQARRSGSRPTASCAPAPCATPASTRCAAASSTCSAGLPEPDPLDFFGDTLESIRSFDPETQRSVADLRALDLVPLSEAPLTTETHPPLPPGLRRRLRRADRDDRLYEAVSEGRRYPGLEHWLPLLHERLDTLFDYLPACPWCSKRWPTTRRRAAGAGEGLLRRPQKPGRRGRRASAPTGPLPPDALYVAPEEWAKRVEDLALARLSPFATPEGGAKLVVDLGARRGRNFVAERADENANLFEAAVRHIRDLQAKGRRVVVGAWSEGSRERLSHVLGDHGLDRTRTAGRLSDALGGSKDDVPVVVWGLEAGFEARDFCRYRRAGHPRRSPRPREAQVEAAAGLF